MKKNKKLKIFIVVAIVFAYVMLQIVPYSTSPQLDTPFKIEDGARPLVASHGGAKLLYPENTIMAFEESAEMGVDILEMDLCLTKDDVLLTHHNLTIDSTTQFEGNVRDYTYEEILAMNFGYRFENLDGEKPYENETDRDVLDRLVPMTVEQMFNEYSKTDMLYIMEIKDKGEDGALASKILNDYITEYGVEEKVCAASFYKMDDFASIKAEETVLSMDLATSTKFVLSNLVGIGIFQNYTQKGLQLPMKKFGINLTMNYIIYKIHHNDMFIHYWTINDREDMQKLIEKGADAIITDRPDIMLEVLEEMGY